MIGSSKALFEASSNKHARRPTPWNLLTWNPDVFSTDNPDSWLTQGSSNFYHPRFVDNGYKLFVLNNNSVSRYDLTTPYDLTTATVAQDRVLSTGGYGLAAKSDGTKIFASDRYNRRVREWTLTTPFDLTTAQQTAQLNFTFDRVDPIGIDSSGTHLIVGGDGGYDYTVSFTLSTPWDLSTAQSDMSTANFFIVPSSERIIEFGDSGSRLFIGREGGGIYSYSLTTPYTVPDNLDVVSGFSALFTPGNMRSFTFSADGLTLFVLRYTNNDIQVYTLATAYDISSPTLAYTTAALTTIDATFTQPYDIKIKPDGTTLLLLDYNNRKICQLSMSTPWDLTTLSYAGNSFTVYYVPQKMSVSPDGTRIATGNYYYNRFYEYVLTTGWDVRTEVGTSNQGSGSLVSILGGYPYHIAWSSDGSYGYALADNVAYKLVTTTPYSVIGASWPTPTAGYDSSNTGWMFEWAPDGTYYYVIDDYQWIRRDLSEAWNISSKTASVDVLPVGFSGGTARSVMFNADGSDAYIRGALGNVYSITKVDLTTPYDLVNLRVDLSSDLLILNPVPSQTMVGLWMNSDGTVLTVCDERDEFDVYQLTTPYDINTAAFWYEGNHPNYSLYMFSVQFSPDGLQAYYVSRYENRIYYQNLATPYDTRTVVSQSIANLDFDGYRDFENFSFASDGLGIFGASSRDYITYTPLTSPYNLATVQSNSFIRSYKLTTVDGISSIRKVWVSDDGLTILGSNFSSTLFMWKLTSPNDITTMSYVGSRSISQLVGAASRPLHILDAGDKIVYGPANGLVGLGTVV